MIHSWLHEVSAYQNQYADAQLMHFYRSVFLLHYCDSSSLLECVSYQKGVIINTRKMTAIDSTQETSYSLVQPYCRVCVPTQKCELSLLVLSCASRVFLRVLRFSSLHKNQPWFDQGCAPWPDMSRMAAARGALVCLRLGHVELRPRNSATMLQVGMIS